MRVNGVVIKKGGDPLTTLLKTSFKWFLQQYENAYCKIKENKFIFESSDNVVEQCKVAASFVAFVSFGCLWLTIIFHLAEKFASKKATTTFQKSHRF